MKVFIAGFPHIVGGAGGEAWHAALVWQRYGVTVEWIPTWGRGERDYEPIVQAAGQTIHRNITPRNLRTVPGLAGSPVVMFCNERAAGAWQKFRELKCRIIAVPCMTYWLNAYRRVEWDAVVCQSEFQRDILKRPDAVVIRGAFAFWDAECRPRPHVPGEPFYVGRMARETPKKWHHDLWRLWGQIPNVRGIAMGVGPAALRQLGKPPEWAQAMPAGQIPALDFYRQLHLYFNANHADRENWPRVGLEAMAYGVPLIAENQWGWREMVVHNESGFLYDAHTEAIEYARQLEQDEELRLRIVAAGRKRLEELAAPEPIWAGWRRVFGC